MRKDVFIRQGSDMILVITLLQPVDDLAFLQAAVPDRRKNAVPVLEPVLLCHRLCVFGLQKLWQIQAFRFAEGSKQLLSADDVVFFSLMLEPLINLVLRLRAPDDLQPVSTGAF